MQNMVIDLIFGVEFVLLALQSMLIAGLDCVTLNPCNGQQVSCGDVKDGVGACNLRHR